MSELKRVLAWLDARSGGPEVGYAEEYADAARLLSEMASKCERIERERDALRSQLLECGQRLQQKWTPDNDAHMRALTELAEARAEVERLRKLLPEAFEAGIARAIGSHEDFKQTHPDKDEWIRAKEAERE